MSKSSQYNDDPLFDYQNFINKDRLKLLKVFFNEIPLVSISLKELVLITVLHIDEKIKEDESKISYVLFLNSFTFYSSLINSKRKSILKDSFINISQERGTFLPFNQKNLSKKNIHHILPVSYVLSLLHIAQAKEFNVFFFCSHAKKGRQFMQNIKRSFPKLNIIGNYNYGKSSNITILESFRKTNSSIVLLGLGSFSAEINWLQKNKDLQTSSLIIALNNSLDNFLQTPTGLSSYFYHNHVYSFWKSIINPFLWYRWILFFFWFIQTGIYRMYLLLKK